MSENQLDEALNPIQRLKRSMAMRRNKEKLKRGRERAKRKMAGAKNLAKRAMNAARKIIRKRVAGARGANYNELSATEKFQIDKQMDKKRKAVKRLASRLVQKVRGKEMKRLKHQHDSFTKGAPLKPTHTHAEGVDYDLENVLTEMVSHISSSVVTPDTMERLNTIIEGHDILIEDARDFYVEQFAVFENEEVAFDMVELMVEGAKVQLKNYSRFRQVNNRRRLRKGSNRRLNTSSSRTAKTQKSNSGVNSRSLRYNTDSRWQMRTPHYKSRYRTQQTLSTPNSPTIRRTQSRAERRKERRQGSTSYTFERS